MHKWGLISHSSLCFESFKLAEKQLIHTKQLYYCHNKCNAVGVSLCDDLSHMVLAHVCIWICWQWNLDYIWHLLMGRDSL